MRVTLTGATGLIGPRLVAALLDRGDEVTVLSRDAGKARERLPGVEAFTWADPTGEPAPAEALAGRDGVVHLAGEPLAQRWTDDAKRRVLESRELGTRNLVEGMRRADPPPPVLVSASGAGYYGFRDSEPLPESAPPGEDFLARVCVAWEREAAAHPGRSVSLRTGVVLDPSGGALAKMLPFFKLGIGGPVAGGDQPLPWIHPDDLVAMYLRALDDERWSGPVNAVGLEAVDNRAFSKALGRVIKRPAFAPVPEFAIRLLYGEMGDLVVEGQQPAPDRALELGHEFRHPQLEPALRDALGR